MFSHYFDGPFNIQFSFQWLIERWERIVATEKGWSTQQAQELLKKVDQYPELKEGITNLNQLVDYEAIISDLLIELFPKALTGNEIKAVTLPFQNLLINKSQRFAAIINDAGSSLEFAIRDFNSHQFYVLNCCLILREFYGIDLDFSKPLFYDIPTKAGILKHYRILYNADFLRPIPTSESKSISQDDINLLIDNYDDLTLWKEMFPPGSWDLKGFAIVSLVDVTIENALSTLKSNLSSSFMASDVDDRLTSIFKSIFRVDELRVGFTFYDSAENRFYRNRLAPGIRSFLLPDKGSDECRYLSDNSVYSDIAGQHNYIAVSNVNSLLDRFPDDKPAKVLRMQGAQSFILAPIIKDGNMLGILELISPNVGDLNSVSAHKLDFIMPFLIDTIERRVNEIQDRTQALIQNNYTSLHPSVYWKFRLEADQYFQKYYENLILSMRWYLTMFIRCLGKLTLWNPPS